MPNRLAQETSPYLRQHQDNLVDWYPWGEEALARARAENKPILLSVGYSACHWCHVMAHESFEDPETARLMNERFINIKVDREERPDLDQIYQNVAQAMTGGGGWPLTVFLTPDLRPYYGGTYFPPEDKYGRPGFKRVLEALSDAFTKQPALVARNSEKLAEVVAELETLQVPPEKELPTREQLEEIVDQLTGAIDWEHGGFGGAPKFPNTMMLTFFWRMWLGTGAQSAGQAAVLSLLRMAQGGIHDQLGGGFSRYSVDEFWIVPHFEKMLYDNALLLKLYSEVLLTDELGKERLLDTEVREYFLDVAQGIVEYALREMRTSEGGFYAAQDADSEGEEGKFFVWDPKSLRSVLTEDEALAAERYFGVTEQGNFEHHQTVLHLSSPPEDPELIARIRRKLFEAREKRVKPGLDDKVLTAWNGLMISGLAWAAEALARGGRSDVARRARSAALATQELVRVRLADASGRLHATYQRGKPRFNAYLDDYAFMAQASLDLARFETDRERLVEQLEDSERWLRQVFERFRDESAPGYFFTSVDHEQLIQRPKTIQDQAIPSGTAVALSCMAALVEMDRNGAASRYRDELRWQLQGLTGNLMKNPYGHGELLCSALLVLGGPVVVSGSTISAAFPHPHVFQKEPAAGQPEPLVCHRQTCGSPHPDQIRLRLE